MDYEIEPKRKEILKAAKRYIELGLTVIPFRGKVPLISDWQKRAGPPTLAEVVEWQRRCPGMNIGLVLGSAPGIVGLWYDGPAAVRWLGKLTDGNMPETWAFSMPDGSSRYLFRLPEGENVKTWSAETSDGGMLAFLGDGHKIVIPPSTIDPYGGWYDWFPGRSPDECELADAPEWMLKPMRERWVMVRRIQTLRSQQG